MDVKDLKLDLKNEITEKYKNLYKSKIDKIDESSKLFLYKNLEPSLERKFYLSFNDFSIRSIFTKFRISDHSLEIETKNKNLYSQINYTLQWYREVTYKNTTQHIHDK
jgi:hypothetical protein